MNATDETNLSTAREILRDLDGSDATVGLSSPERLQAFARQLTDSVRRIRYFDILRERNLCQSRQDPANRSFDPYRGILVHLEASRHDEAFWLAFLATHFGKHLTGGWAYLRAVYGALGGEWWTWERVTDDIEDFKQWLADHEDDIRERPGGFGNHRKYESLSATSGRGTGTTIESYLNWVGEDHCHATKIENETMHAEDSSEARFACLYDSLRAVSSFGRTARFDHLCLLGKLGLTDVEPGRPFFAGATGPKRGAELITARNGLNAKDLEELVAPIAEKMPWAFKYQILEDALCNWQKTPDSYVRFRG